MKHKYFRIRPTLGLFLLAATILVSGSMSAQTLKGLKNVTDKVSNAGKTVTEPIKNTRKATKEITQPIKDVRQAGKDITQPVKDVKREVKGVRSDANKIQSEVDKAKQDAQKARNAVRSNRKKDGDDKAKADSDTTAAPKTRMRSGSISAGQAGDKSQGQAATAPTRTITVNESRSVLLPPDRVQQRERQPDRINPNAPGSKTRSRTASAAPRRETGESGSYAYTSSTPRPERNYSTSPAQKSLERSDFDVETLEDLFTAAIWTGPDSAHTARSIAYMLKQFRYDIDETKQADPSFDTKWYEERYRNWKALYAKETRTREEE